MSWFTGAITSLVTGAIGSVADASSTTTQNTSQQTQTAQKVNAAVKPKDPGITIETKINIPKPQTGPNGGTGTSADPWIG